MGELDRAITEGDYKLAKKLLGGCGAPGRLLRLRPALAQACASPLAGSLGIASLLLDAGAPVSADSEAMVAAAGSLFAPAEKIALLAARGEATEAPDGEEGKLSPALAAAGQQGKGSGPALRALAAAGADLNGKWAQKRERPCVYAAKLGNAPALAALLELGADPSLDSAVHYEDGRVDGALGMIERTMALQASWSGRGAEKLRAAQMALVLCEWAAERKPEVLGDWAARCIGLCAQAGAFCEMGKAEALALGGGRPGALKARRPGL